MKLSVGRNELWRGIDTVLDAVPSKPTMPVLANLLMEADGENLYLAATDLELSIRTQIAADIEIEGRVAVPARTLADIAREWPEAQLHIEVDEERLRLSGQLGSEIEGEGSYVLSGMDAEDFPEIPTQLEGTTLAFESGGEFQLAEMVNKTVFAVSRDETRPILNGVYWSIEDEGMIMVATDGHRLASFKTSLPNGGTGKAEAILPPQACNHLVKLSGNQRQLNSATLGESQVLFDLGDTVLLSRLIDGPYVEYGQVIPQGNDTHLRIDREKLLSTVRRVSILSSSYTHQVRMVLKDHSLELSATSQEIGGEAREVLQVDYGEEELEIAYNAQYLMEILRKIDSQEVVFDLKNSVTAALLRPGEGEEEEDYFCLLMPLRPSG